MRHGLNGGKATLQMNPASETCILRDQPRKREHLFIKNKTFDTDLKQQMGVPFVQRIDCFPQNVCA